MKNPLIESIDAQIAKLEAEKARLVAADKIPVTNEKIQKYLSNTYNGKRLSEKFAMTDEGLWEVTGEDPNCDLGGYHHEPKLGIVEGTFKDALIYGIEHKDFYTWGGGGDIKKITPIKIIK